MNKIVNIISDIDNVITDSREWAKSAPCCENDGKHNREAWDYHHSQVHTVTLNYRIKDFYRDLVNKGLRRIFFITSREDINGLREKTIEQLQEFFGDIKGVENVEMYFYMRNALDYRPAWIIKEETMLQKILPYYSIDLAIDDGLSNIEMFKTYNIDTYYYTDIINL